MTFDDYVATRDALRGIGVDPEKDIVTFCTKDYAMRGVITYFYGSGSTVLLIECIDAFDTSGAGNDFVAVPLSELVQIKHDAKKARYERNKFADIAKSGLKGK